MPRKTRILNFRRLYSVFIITGVLFCVTALDAPSQQTTEEEALEYPCKAAKRFTTLLKPLRTQTANQEDYDVTYYTLVLSIDPSTETITGSVTVYAGVLSATLTHIELDLLDNMTVTGVTIGGTPMTFTHSDDILDITLDRTYNQGETVITQVNYHGTPDPSMEAFVFDTRNGNPMIWSLSEPYGARSWWPCKDSPSDKADSVDVEVTVPDPLIVASNGILKSQSSGSGVTTYHWHEGYPIATYLVSIAIHPYTQFSDWYHYSPSDSMEVSYFVFPENYENRQVDYSETVSMIECFAEKFGEYPFVNEKYGHAEFMSSYAGMEHQTISSLSGASEYLIAHELAHQWWGDMITCRDFHHIWLNEGFAYYCEALWGEDKYGSLWYKYRMISTKSEFLRSGTIYIPDDVDITGLSDFNYHLHYRKGAWVLHMLRHVVGDAVFFDILQAYYNDSDVRYSAATTEDFQRVCETVSGLDLDFFFHQWIYEKAFPIYGFGWSAVPGIGGSWDLTVEIDQRQDGYVFEMPVDLLVHDLSGNDTVVVWNSLTSQTFEITTDAQPIAVELDPDEWILRDVEEKYPVSNVILASNTPTPDIRLDFCDGNLDTFVLTVDLPDVISVDEIPESLITLVPSDPPNSTIRFISDGPIYADSAATQANGFTTTITHSDIIGAGADLVSVAIDGETVSDTAPIYVLVCQGSGSGKVKPGELGDVANRIPKITELGTASPNPFNQQTVISYQLSSTTGTRVEIVIYDVKGRLVHTLVDRWQPQGMYSVSWDGRDNTGKSMSSGIYFYCMTAGNFSETKKMLLLR